ncbi:MAG: DUF4399 domain-containing protein [Vicinamibacterales bacterium]
MLRLRRNRFLVPALAAAIGLIVACGGDDEGNDATTDGTTGAEEFTAAITNPDDGATLDAGDIEVALDVGDFEVVDKLGDAPVTGEGHVHYYIDVETIPTTPGKPAITDDEMTYHAEATTSYTWQGVRPGEHIFGVQLVNNDHTPLEPPVTDEITVTVD